MALKRDISVPKKGMNRDTHPAELSKEEYSFALNANFHNENGNGKVILQNETSNVKCSGFKTGYVVVGHKYDLNSELTYFFLTNPTTGFSEIGVISSIPESFSLTPTEVVDANGNIRVQLETPLEEQTQVGYCNYTTIISDECTSGSQSGSKCLNFSIEDPFHENNIHIKYGRRGKTLWFTHLRNPQRYIQLDNLGIYTSNVDPCDDDVTDVCLDCEKMRVFPLYEKPCLQVREVVGGGSLKAGNYEVGLAYCDIYGNELTDYSPLTPQVRIFDANNNILDQTLLDYLTNQAIVVDVNNIDIDFEFYKVVVVYTSGLDGTKTPFVLGVYPSNQDTITIYNLQNSAKITIGEVLNQRPFYERAKGMAVSNGYMYQYGLKTNRVVNLQPIVNLMGSFAMWNTYIAKESLYKDGAAMAKYGGYMRNETYPFAIVFDFIGGYSSNTFPLIARPPKTSELVEIDTLEVDSINDYNPECGDTERKYRWQFENTAEEVGQCLVPAGQIDENSYELDIESSCIVQDEEGATLVVDTIADSEFEVPAGVTDIVNYINANRDAIIASTGTNGADIRNIIEDPDDYPLAQCVASFADNCSEVVSLVSEEIFAISVGSQTITETAQEATLDNTTPANPPSSPCQIYEVDGSGNPTNNTTFESTFMYGGEIVYNKLAVANNICNTATQPNDISFPLSLGYHLLDKGEIDTVSTLRSSNVVTTVNTKLKIALVGTSGSCNININGVNYLATFNTSLIQTATDFVTTHGPTIAGLTLSAVGPNIEASGNVGTFYVTSSANVSGDLAVSFDNEFFSNRLHTNAIWFKIPFGTDAAAIFEITKTLCINADDNNSNRVRITAFNSCPAGSQVVGVGSIVEDITVDSNSKFLNLVASDFSGTAYIAIDSPIRSRFVAGDSKVLNTLTPPCGCFYAFTRKTVTVKKIEYKNLTFGKRQVYKSECLFSTPTIGNCEAVPYKKGTFSYWESTERYPCNKELFDSSELIITPSDIPSGIRTDFESYFTAGTINGEYILTSNADFRDKNIRHYKFPDNTVAPFMSDYTQNPGDFQEAFVYPIGFNLSPQIISAFLDIAVKNNLLTTEERSRITGYRILRGDRTIHRSVIAKGLLFDMYKYQDRITNKDIYYPNYPLNALGQDTLNNVPHPFAQSSQNNFFTFHSPETDYYRPSLPRELYVEGYQFGKSASYFDEVRSYPTFTLMGDDAYTLASTLAGIEVAFEVFLQSTSWVVLAATGGFSALVAGALAVVGVASLIGGSIFTAGRYRYQWLQTFRGLGKPSNFGYYQAALGHYNYFRANNLPFQKLRGLSLISYLRDGMFEIPEESTATNYQINAFDREWSVTLRTGNYSLLYDPTYVGHDNTSNSNSSRITDPNTVGKSPAQIGNVASPYASIIQYNPSQWGQLGSFAWIETGFCGNLEMDEDCSAVFGGDIFISRHSLKRKLPLFRNNAFGLPPNTPFKHSDYFNINPPDPTQPSSNITDRFFLDFEVNDNNSGFVAAVLFPGARSFYNLDSGGSSIGDFYVKPPNKFYLYSYGVPYFLVESEINCNFRYAKREKFQNFYPNVPDIIEFTQEENVSIKAKNEFFYNNIYSSAPLMSAAPMLPVNYERHIFDRLNDLTNTIIYSQQDLSERSAREPWRSYKAIDSFEFSKSFGDLVTVNGIESLQILVRTTNGFTIYGSLDQLRDRMTPETGNLGSGGIFAGRPVNFNTTNLGHGGTQHNAMVSCEYGHFWVDSKRGKVFHLGPNGKEFYEISKGRQGFNNSLEKWFKENLPFKILRTIPTANIDNNYKGLGISMVWDERLKRLLLTKLDYVPLIEDYQVIDGTIYLLGIYDEIIAEQEALGWTYVGIEGNELVFTQEGTSDECPCITFNYTVEDFTDSITPSRTGTTNGRASFEFQIGLETYNVLWSGTEWQWYDSNNNLIATKDDETQCPNGRWVLTSGGGGFENPFNAIESKSCDPQQGGVEFLRIPLQTADFNNPQQFRPCSWTVAYNPMLDSWISYYSYKPNYYIGYNDYFQSGVNFSGNKFGLWSHLPYLSSYQVFYGELHPFIVEFPIPTQYANSVLSSVQYWLDTRKYYNEHNYTDVFGIGFNKAVVYNNFQNTGLLQLVHQDTHNVRQNLEYPKHNVSDTEILQTEMNGQWSFNYLYNAVKNEAAGLPLWREDCAQIEKTLDNRLLEFKPVWKDYLRGDYFLVRLIQDKESRYKLLTRWIINEKELYND